MLVEMDTATSTTDIPLSSTATLDSHIPSVHIQIFPHSEVSLHQALSRYNRHFMFKPIEQTLVPGVTIKMGRKIDSKKEALGTRWSRDEQIAHNASLQVLQDDELVVPQENMFPDQASSPETGFLVNNQIVKQVSGRRQELISFRSKVVSRTHAELWMGRDGQVSGPSVIYKLHNF